jgi:Flp pilus assembly protein CpaB
MPGRRAVVGGLLVAVAVVGTFAAYSTAGSAPSDRVLVARASVSPGDRLSAADVRVERATLPADLTEHVLSDPDDLADAVALVGLEPGEIVQRSAVLERDASASETTAVHEFSLPVDRDRALNGAIARGELVDVLATYGTSDAAYTVTVARRSRVVDVADTSGGLGSDGRVVLTLAMPSPDEVMAATHASAVAVVTVVRATRAGDLSAPDRYSPAERTER